RIDCDVHLGAAFRAQLLADEQHWGFVELAFADNDGAVDRQLVELAPHGVDRRLVGGSFRTATAQPRRRDRSALREPHDLDRKDGLEEQVRMHRDRVYASLRHRLDLAFLVQLFSIRITCGFSTSTPSCSMAANAWRTASSVVA